MSDSARSSLEAEKSESVYTPVRHERLTVGNIRPYARSSRDSNHSGSVWEDAQSAQSARSNLDDADDLLAMLAAEINNRKYPTETAMIMEDSPEVQRSTSERKPISDIDMTDQVVENRNESLANLSDPTAGISQPGPSELPIKTETCVEDSRIIADQMKVMQDTANQKFTGITSQLQNGQDQQNHIMSTTDALVESLKEALTALQSSQNKHESILRANEIQLNALLQSNTELMAKTPIWKALLSNRFRP